MYLRDQDIEIIKNNSMASLTELENYLNQYGWSFERQGENALITGFISESSEEKFLLIIELLPPWLRFRIPFYLPTPIQSNWDYIAKELLKLNYNSRQVYFGISDDEGIVLIIDVFMELDFSYDTFEVAVDLITYVAETSFLPLMSFLDSVNRPK